MWSRMLQTYIFPPNKLDFVKSRIAKMHDIVEKVMSPPYPRLAPTYKQLDESELIKLNLLLFIPVERTERLQFIVAQLELTLEELEVADVNLIEQKNKLDDTERSEFVIEETAEHVKDTDSDNESVEVDDNEEKKDDDDYDYDEEKEDEENDDDDEKEDEEEDVEKDDEGSQTLGKWVRVKRDCPVCGQSKSNIVSHLQRVHKKTHRDALNLSQGMRKTKASTKNVLDRVPCPIETCNKPVKRLDKHLKTVHKLKPSSPSFIRYNTQSSKLRKDIEKEIKDDNGKKTPQKTQKKRDKLAEKGRKFVVSIPSKKPAAKRQLQLCDNPTSPSQHPSDGSPPSHHSSDSSPPSHHSSDSSPPSHHSSNDYPDSPDLFIDSSPSHPSDEIPTLEHPDVRAEPPEELAVPKEIQRSSIAKVVEIQPLLARFLDHLLSVEGGRRGPKPSKEAQWRVGRLLYEVDETLANVNLLWNDDAMVHIRLAFIEGNHLLTKPRKVGTLRAYLTALLMFYNFLLTRASSLANEFGLQQNDFSLIKEFQGRVSNWMKSFTEESASRKTEVHHEDFQSLLTSSQMWNLFNSPLHNEFEERFEKLDDPVNEFVELRDYLITMLLLQSAQRPGAVCNLTINEFQAGEWDESTSVKQFVTLTKRHKTAGTGPASLSWDTRIYKCAQIYLEVLRPTVANNNSFLQRKDKKEKEPLFFLTARGNPIPSSQISNRITKVAKLLDPSISGNVTGKRIRKSAVTSHRQLDDSGESSGLSKEELARQMSHSTSTAEGHYAMRDTIKGRARASNFLRYVVAKTPEKAKSPNKMKPEGLWKAVVRRKVSPEKPLRSLRKQLSANKRIPQKSPKKKKIYFLPRETQALMKATEAFYKEDNFDPDAIWQCINNDEACQKLKITEKYGKMQLRNKVKRHAKARKLA